MFLKVVSATYVGEYKLKLTFNDGITKIVDLEDELHGAVFESLKELDMFKQLTINEETNTIEWPNGADLAPEFLYEIGFSPVPETVST